MSLVTSIQRGGSNNHETTSEEANGVYTDFVSEGVLGTTANTSGVAPATGGWAVNAQGTPDMTVAVGAGTAYVTATPSTQASQTFRIVSSAEEDVTISANSSGSTKYDWLYLKLDATTLNAPNVAGDDAATLVTSRSSSITSDDGTPPTYGILLAVITVANGAVSITNGNIKDSRTQASIGASTSDSTGWFNLGATPNTITNNGNRSYDMVFNSVDLTGYLSAGQRLRLTRTVSAPTQCADLESGSSQYYSKTSPNKLTFVDDFTCMAWVKLESYTFGGIMARRNGDTEGWSMAINASGQLEGLSLRIGSNNRTILTYQSIPLGKWTHVAFTMDNSANTHTMYIDGISVPFATTTNGTITALVQGTTALVVGAYKSAGTSPFDGKIAQAAVFGAVLSAATIASYASQTLSGSETNLLSAYSFSNSITDLNTTTPNDLTPQGSAVATSVDSPFGNHLGGTLEYGIITKTAFSTNTTLTVQVPEGCAIPTSGGVSAVAYATSGTPYGFPADEGRWDLIALYKTSPGNLNNTSVAQVTGHQLLVPVGGWRVGGSITALLVSASLGASSDFAISASTSVIDDASMSTRVYVVVGSQVHSNDSYVEKGITLSSATNYYLVNIGTNTPTMNNGATANHAIYIIAKCALL